MPVRYEVNVLGKKFEVEVEEVDRNVFEVVVNGKKAIIKMENR
jgi:hypothetical protein